LIITESGFTKSSLADIHKDARKELNLDAHKTS
jgi:hypothetical protein